MTRSTAQIQEWLVQRLGSLMGMDPAELDVREPIVRFGLDSVSLIALTADLEDWLGYRLKENPLNDYPTIEALSQFLAEQSTPCR